MIIQKSSILLVKCQKNAELDKVLSNYLVSIDAEDVQDVYQARLEELDHFEAQSREIFARECARLDPVADADKIAQQKKRLDDNLQRFQKNREGWRCIALPRTGRVARRVKVVLFVGGLN